MNNEVWVGIDIGGTDTKLAISSAKGNNSVKEKWIAENTMATRADEGPTAVLDRLMAATKDLLDQAGSLRPSAIGVGIPGLVDLKTGVTKFLPNLKTQWRDIPVGDRLSSRFGCPVRLMNDVRTATLGELRFGRGRHLPNTTMAFVSIGTGIGGGLVIDGKLRLGPLGAAGEIGHQTILPEGPLCGCGNRGCLEALASGPAIVHQADRLMAEGHATDLAARTNSKNGEITTKDIGQAALHDTSLQDLISRTGHYIGIGVANVVSVLHPDLVVIGGGVAGLGDRLLTPIRETVRERVRMFPVDDVKITSSELGSQAGVWGAIALAGVAENDSFPFFSQDQLNLND